MTIFCDSVNNQSLLLIEDDEIFAITLSRSLTKRGFSVIVAASSSVALQYATSTTIDFVLLDLNLDGENSMFLIPSLIEANPNCKIVVLTGYASIATTVQAIKMGATQYLAKPVDVNAVIKALSGEEEMISPFTDDPLRMDRLEWEHIQRVLAENNGNVSATARCLKMHRRTLQRKLRKRPSSY